MFNSQILDAVIGLVTVYFLLSLLCSVIVEIITSLTKKRARMLSKGILLLLKDPEAQKRLYKQPLFMGDMPPEGFWQYLRETVKRFFLSEKKTYPSYISSHSFVISLLESLKQHPEVVKKLESNIPAINSVNSIKTLVSGLPDGNAIKMALLPLLETGVTSVDKAIENMEKWYDEAMDRVTGWYKRRPALRPDCGLCSCFAVECRLVSDREGHLSRPGS